MANSSFLVDILLYYYYYSTITIYYFTIHTLIYYKNLAIPICQNMLSFFFGYSQLSPVTSLKAILFKNTRSQWRIHNIHR